MSAATDATLAVDPLSTNPAPQAEPDPAAVAAVTEEQHQQHHQQHVEQEQQQHAVEEHAQTPASTKRKAKSNKEAPKKIYFCARPGCTHAFNPDQGRRPCYVQNGSFSKGAHKRSCGGGYRWLELGDVEREPNVQLEQSGQQFFLNITGPHTLEPRQGRAGHSPHMVRLMELQAQKRGDPSVIAVTDPTPDIEPGNVVITADDAAAAYDGSNEAALAQAALTAGQQHPVAAITGPPADVQAAMAGVSTDIQHLVSQLWQQVAELQKSHSELNHRTSAAEQAAQLLVGAAQRERQASAAAAAESKQIRAELAMLKASVAGISDRLDHLGVPAAATMPVSEPEVAAAAPMELLPVPASGEAVSAPILTEEHVDVAGLGGDIPAAVVGKTGLADETLPPAKRMRATNV